MADTRAATVDDLYEVGGEKAELVSGRTVLMPPAGFLPSYATGEIYVGAGLDTERRPVVPLRPRLEFVGPSLNWSLGAPARL